MKIDNVVLPFLDNTIYDITLSTNGIDSRVARHDQSTTSPSLLLPALCHPHIHLDKAFLLTSNVPRSSQEPVSPDYSDLTPQSGTFQEALNLTSQAKFRYTLPDLLLRGSQLIAESISYGVTSMRAFVEVDHVTKFKCIEAAIQLKKKFAASCYIQICAFAQDPIMSGDLGHENRTLMDEVLRKYPDIEALGTTPYVESDFDRGLQNVKWAVQTALARNLHLDFHLDYNLDVSQKPMVYDVIRQLHESKWNEVAQGKCIVLGHCTRMTLFDDEELQKLRDLIADLPVAFVGLPTSDLFMMGRPGTEKCSGSRSRGTLQVLQMIREHGFDACIGVNNVGNAFTPWGNLDPLRLASLGIGLYQGGTTEDASILYECVSTRATRAIGIRQWSTTENETDSREADLSSTYVSDAFLKIDNKDRLKVHGIQDTIPARMRLSIKDVVWDPPERDQRELIRRT